MREECLQVADGILLGLDLFFTERQVHQHHGIEVHVIDLLCADVGETREDRLRAGLTFLGLIDPFRRLDGEVVVFPRTGHQLVVYTYLYLKLFVIGRKFDVGELESFRSVRGGLVQCR